MKNIFKKLRNLLSLEKPESTQTQSPTAEKNNLRSYYTVEHYIGHKIITYDNIAEAAKKLKISRKTVQRICRGEIQNPKYNLAYGEKKQQEVVNYNNDRKW
ncbi:MAG: NUMOD1 domain-containing DNA-binding protein [bacterium]